MESLKCGICETPLINHRDYGRHLQIIHNTTLTLTCDICLYEAEERGIMNRHFTQVHPASKGEGNFIIYKLASRTFQVRWERERRRKEEKKWGGRPREERSKSEDKRKKEEDTRKREGERKKLDDK